MGGFPVAGAVLGLGAAALAYAGFRLVNQVNDKSITLGLLDSRMIDYLPKVKVVETKDFLEQYLQSVTTMQFFTILLDNRDLFRSQTILNLVSEVSVKQQDIRGDTKIQKLSRLIDKLKQESRESAEKQMALEYGEKKEEFLKPTEPIQPVEETLSGSSEPSEPSSAVGNALRRWFL